MWFFVLLDFSYTGVIFEIINKETTVKIKDPKLLAKKQMVKSDYNKIKNK